MPPSDELSLRDIDSIFRSDEDPESHPEWPGVRHVLRNEFGDGHSDAGLWQRFTDYLQHCGGDLSFYLAFHPSDLSFVLKEAERRRNSIAVPLEIVTDEDGSKHGIMPEWAVQQHGVLLDYIMLGPPGSGNGFPISSFDAKVVQGGVPSVCPSADRELPEALLPTVVEVFANRGLLKPGQTIHWVGSQSRIENLCTCDLAAKESRSERAAAKKALLLSNAKQSANDDYISADKVLQKLKDAGLGIEKRTLAQHRTPKQRQAEHFDKHYMKFRVKKERKDGDNESATYDKGTVDASIARRKEKKNSQST